MRSGSRPSRISPTLPLHHNQGSTTWKNHSVPASLPIEYGTGASNAGETPEISVDEVRRTIQELVSQLPGYRLKRVDMRHENDALHGGNGSLDHPDARSDPGVQFQGLRGTKRKVLANISEPSSDVAGGPDVLKLVGLVQNGMAERVPDETIFMCGMAPLMIMKARPDEVLELAYQMLNARPYSDVQKCWRRLYEDATLQKVITLLLSEASAASTFSNGSKHIRFELEGGHEMSHDVDQDWLSYVVATMDHGIIISGCPARRRLFEAIFEQLFAFLRGDEEYYDSLPATFNVTKHLNLQTRYPIRRFAESLSFEAFQMHLNTANPCINPGILSHWPALQSWKDPSYLLRLMHGGRRLVPVEIGSSYTDEGWGQRLMPMREFLSSYVLPRTPQTIGYLAQHDLFEQLPALQADITIPDYCYTSPPAADTAALQTAGLSSVKHLDEPLRNAWFGPKGTKTPLHTDPYHNILCQVVGYKYIRLYAPSETAKLYPRGTDDSGISMENTSLIDVSLVRHAASTFAAAEFHASFPLFETAQFVEGVLGPGECLYIPVGWWHYVESLSTSFSVSFWWN